MATQWAWLRRPTVRGGMLAFVLVHGALLLWLWPTIARGDALGDLEMYREWAVAAFRGDHIIGLRSDWVFPLLAWLPIGLANLFGPEAYQAVWFGMVTVLNLLATLVVLGTTRDDPRPYAAYVWLAGILLLAPVSMLRIEGFVAPFVVAALLWLRRWPFIAGVILAVMTWVKVWPAAILAAVLASRQGRGRILPAGILVTAAVTVVSSLTGGLTHLLSFLSKQAERALQIESPLATLPMWLDTLGVSGYYTYYNRVLDTPEMGGAVPTFIAAISTYLLIAVFVIIVGMIAAQRFRGVVTGQLMLTGALALVTTTVVLNKVGTPQFVLWLLPVVVVGLVTRDPWWHRIAWLLLATCALTTAVFPFMYAALEQQHIVPIIVLTLRNLLLVTIFAMAVVRVLRFQPLR